MRSDFPPVFCHDKYEFHREAAALGKVFLSFDYGKGMRSSDGKPLQCFEVAEYDGIYYPATAEVVGDQVKVYSKEVPNPRYVRYGWQPFTRANLINREGLPASTFRAEFSMK